MQSRKGFWAKTPSGGVAHICGDPNMPQETLDALLVMMDLIMQQEAPAKGWSVEEFSDGCWHRINAGSEKLMRSFWRRRHGWFVGRFRLLNAEGEQVEEFELGG